MAGGHAWLIPAGTLVLAGIYQLTPLKYRCLEQCRSPLGFIMARWRGCRARAEAFRLGVHHGLFCVGCCWALMLLMFGVGVGNLGWMLGLGAVMAAEKNLLWGRRLGVGLLGCGMALGALSAWRRLGKTACGMEHLVVEPAATLTATALEARVSGEPSTDRPRIHETSRRVAEPIGDPWS